MGFDFTKLDTAVYVKREDTVKEPFTEMEIDALGADVRILPSEDGSCSVHSRLNEKIDYSLSVSDGKLSVKCTDRRSWYEYIGFGFREETITVYLPCAQYEKLDVKVKSGDVLMRELTAQTANIVSGSGDVKLIDIQGKSMHIDVDSGDATLNSMQLTGALKLKLDSGDAKLIGVQGVAAHVEVGSGDVEMQDLETTKEVTVKTKSGDIAIENSKAGSVCLTAGSGDIEIEELIAKEDMTLKTSSGDIEFKYMDAKTMDIRAGSGDVTGTVLSVKHFIADAASGDIDIPDSDSHAGVCKVETGSGDIKIRVLS